MRIMFLFVYLCIYVHVKGKKKVLDGNISVEINIGVDPFNERLCKAAGVNSFRFEL